MFSTEPFSFLLVNCLKVSHFIFASISICKLRGYHVLLLQLLKLYRINAARPKLLIVNFTDVSCWSFRRLQANIEICECLPVKHHILTVFLTVCSNYCVS